MFSRLGRNVGKSDKQQQDTGSSGTVADIAAQRRRQNALVVTSALTLLGVVSLGIYPFIDVPKGVFLTTLAQTALTGTAYVLVRRGIVVAGAMLTIVTPLLQHVAIVADLNALEVVPFFAGVAVLLAAAMLPLRWLYVGIVLAVASVLTQAALVDLTVSTFTRPAGTLMASLLLLAVVSVISVLHVRGTERAFVLAQERDEARERAAAEAVASEEQHRLIADNTNDLIALISATGRVVYASPSHEKELGYAPDRLVGTNPDHIVAERDRQHVIGHLERALRSGRARGEMRLVTADGEELLFDATFSRVNTADGQLVAILSRNITRQRQLEEQLQKTARMEALERLARGVAHDFNNLLVVISGGADLAAAELPEDHRAHQDIVAIQQAALSATRLIEQLLAFCKRQLSPPTALDPAEELERLSPLVMSLVGRGIDVTMDTEPDCPSIILSASHFEQLVINLVANARDAMNDRGTLHVGLRTRSLEADDVAGLRPDRYVELSVADTGAGIAPDVLSHLFEPFFTTKAESGGTGLGLATCYGIASQHGGQITVESELGNGTTVRVFLPMAQQPAAEQAPSAIDSSRSSAAVPSSRRPASQQTILIADDEPALLQMTTRMLETEGFLVIQAATVGEATSVLEDLTRHIDIVLTDVVLSAGGGTRLLELARRLRPDAVLRVMSAFSPEPEAVAAMQRVGARFLSKPFVRRALLDILRD